MSGYESAPATVMLATHCAVCGRPLVDARSVEAGMGPDCRARYGKADVVSEEARAEANRLVYSIALWRSELLGAPTVGQVAEVVERVRTLGLSRLAEVLADRLCDVRLEAAEDRGQPCLALTTPFRPTFASDLRSSLLPLRRWDPERKAWLLAREMTRDERARLWSLIRLNFEGRLFSGPRGVTAVSPLPSP